MMKGCRAGLSAIMLGWGSLVAAQTVSPSPAFGWRWQPSVYLLGSIDESTDMPLGVNGVEIVEASPAGKVGVGLDVQHHAGEGRLHGVVVGLIRIPASGED